MNAPSEDYGAVLPPQMALVVRADPKDTWSTVAAQFKVTQTELREANPGVKHVRDGTELLVPMKFAQCMTTEGDTWESVAAQFGTTTTQLTEMNPGVHTLTPGTILTIP